MQGLIVSPYISHSMSQITNLSPIATKPRYDVLDGLRGVAALLVVCYHLFECFDFSPFHFGYLAVDFFFILSGFVIGYAYDNRWPAMSLGTFVRRRLIRLHPMVVFGAVLGAVVFLACGSERWDHSTTAFDWVMVAMLLSMFLIPSLPGSTTDVRGNTEIFSLNGPSWSLFFEYIGNVVYAVFLRRLSKCALAVNTFLLGLVLIGVSIHFETTALGWSFSDYGFWGGLIHMLFPYSLGLYMARCFRPMRVRHSFLWGTVLLTAVAIMPSFGWTGIEGADLVFELLCIIVVFPFIVWMGASEQYLSPETHLACRSLGNLSYPLYLCHYPFMYAFYRFIGFDGNLVPFSRFGEVWPYALMLLVGVIVLGFMAYKFYDEPIRRHLSKQ